MHSSFMRSLRRLIGGLLATVITLSNGYAADDEALPLIWDEARPSIYSFIKEQPAHVDMDEISLPDEIAQDDRRIHFSPGAMDGIFSHHGGSQEPKELGTLVQAFVIASNQPNKKTLTSLYKYLMSDDSVLDIANRLLLILNAQPQLNTNNLNRIAFWLATKSPDRNAVKFGIILLAGADIKPVPIDVFITLGRHDEFTLFSTVAILKQRPYADAENALWQLARSVHGWGRIHIVERLTQTQNPAIKDWLLREGYKNKVMYEYLAYHCAQAGDLKKAMQSKAVDEELLLGAADLLGTLTTIGGPASDIGDYRDGVDATALFLAHAAQSPSDDLHLLNNIKTIQNFIDKKDRDWKPYEALGWSPSVRQELSQIIASIIAAPKWKVRIEQDLQSPDENTFNTAAYSASIVGIDPWPMQFERQRNNPNKDQWYFLMQTTDRKRIEAVVALAEIQIDLKKIATGPDDALGLTAEYDEHRKLDWLLQELGAYPGLGWPLLAAGLDSPTTRNRNMALRVLSKWGQAHWPQDAREKLEKAITREPNKDTRRTMQSLLNGESLQQ